MSDAMAQHLAGLRDEGYTPGVWDRMLCRFGVHADIDLAYIPRGRTAVACLVCSRVVSFTDVRAQRTWWP